MYYCEASTLQGSPCQHVALWRVVPARVSTKILTGETVRCAVHTDRLMARLRKLGDDPALYRVRDVAS